MRIYDLNPSENSGYHGCQTLLMLFRREAKQLDPDTIFKVTVVVH